MVVDDGSSDESVEIADRWHRSHPRNIQWFSQDNAGPGAARNRGAGRTTGQYLLFLDADDALLPGALARYRRSFAENPNASLVVAGAQTARNGRIVDTRHSGPASNERLRNFAAFVRGELCPFNGGAVMLHRRVMERLSYPESINTSEDFVFFAQAFSLFDAASAGEPAVVMHRHAGSLRYNPAVLRDARDTMIDLLFDPSVLPEEAMRLRPEVESTWFLVVSRALYMHGDYTDAVRYYRRAVALFPRNLLRTSYLGKFLISLARASFPRD